MLDMGFKPQVERLLKRLPRERQTMLFSATLDGEVGQLAHSYTRDASRFETAPLSDHEEGKIEHRFVSVTADAKVERLVEELSKERGLALVFVRTKRGADRLALRLARLEVDALALHGDMPQNARQRTLRRFRAGEVSTLVATDVAARGLDLEAITHVINFDPPEEDKDYVHRVGRTGRAGRAETASPSSCPSSRPTSAASRPGLVTASSSRAKECGSRRRGACTRVAVAAGRAGRARLSRGSVRF